LYEAKKNGHPSKVEIHETQNSIFTKAFIRFKKQVFLYNG
jgi:hypothetical protein